jgi:hypothetical protein
MDGVNYLAVAFFLTDFTHFQMIKVEQDAEEDVAPASNLGKMLWAKAKSGIATDLTLVRSAQLPILSYLAN